ncbi:O-antigen export system permease protein RfbD [Photobacterium marinum]|uniref:Transport permease protein n=1 Tax=Photobacterium marinum TaxID=1056511 RepID=L8J8D2_9GAMM|nr:ABC transporter permease [Photobacterium marinum]ELR65071.1 O-antigen export system permease protein RfbD [Photobacterium marinum]
MLNFSLSPMYLVRSLKKNFQLIKTLTKRDILGRYKGSFMGLLWSFLTPLFMLSVYTFVFGEILKVRWTDGSSGDVPGQFAMLLFAGLIVFNLFADCVNRAPTLILSNVSYVKKIVFPLEIMPIVLILSTLFHTMISFIVWLAVYVILFGVPQSTLLLLPVVITPFILLMLGLVYFLAAFGVFVRDISQVVGLVCTALMFLSPIFFPISSLPDAYQQVVHLNPLTIPIEQIRNVIYFGELPEWELLANYLSISILVSIVGFYFFQKTRKAFADVL